jgi:UDP-N-acetylmuramate--alanine ligase
LQIELNLPGEHNVRNALAAIAVATELGVEDDAIIKALCEFKGVGRRFTRHGQILLAAGGSFTLIDDYGHHPVEMAATLAAARGAYVGRRLVLAFQPHRYTRTRDCFGEFVEILQEFDAVILTEVYPAGEPRIIGADSASLVSAIKKNLKTAQGCPLQIEQIHFEKDIKQLPQRILEQIRADDVVITMGAGSISAVPGQLLGGHFAPTP